MTFADELQDREDDAYEPDEFVCDDELNEEYNEEVFADEDGD